MESLVSIMVVVDIVEERLQGTVREQLCEFSIGDLRRNKKATGQKQHIYHNHTTVSGLGIPLPFLDWGCRAYQHN
jgi:hypothetical protein